MDASCLSVANLRKVERQEARAVTSVRRRTGGKFRVKDRPFPVSHNPRWPLIADPRRATCHSSRLTRCLGAWGRVLAGLVERRCNAGE